VAPLIVVLFVALAAGVGYLAYRSRQQRIAAVTALAQQLGFTFAKKDTDDIVEMPFALFRMGVGHGAELVISGTHNGAGMRLFDFFFYTESRDAQGNTSRDYSRFTCGLLEIPAACPALQCSHENALTRIGEHLGLHDIEFEYDDFNKRFRVKCDDQKFAFSLFDAQMMEWMLGSDSFDRLEADGRYVLLACRQLKPAEWPTLVTWLDAFRAHVPAVLFSTYPPR
jgi:hypothetical protein